MNIGKRKTLKFAREKYTFTQAEVAKYLGMTTNAYQSIELGIHGTSEENWIKLFNLFKQEFPLDKLMEKSAA